MHFCINLPKNCCFNFYIKQLKKKFAIKKKSVASINRKCIVFQEERKTFL